MKWLPGRSTAASLVSLAILMRTVVELAIFYPYAANASWICPLIGYILFLPFLFALRQAEKLAQNSPWLNLRESMHKWLRNSVQIIFAFILMFDAASIMRLTASSYNVLALNHITVHLLIFPLSAVIVLIMLMGINSVGNSARIAMRFLLALLLILMVVQLPDYKFSFLTPIFGPGFVSILNGSLACAGTMALLSLIWFIAEPDRCPRSLTHYSLFAAAASSIFMIMMHSAYPSMPDMDLTRAARIELVLSNGRMSLAPQFLLNLLWYGCLLYLLSAEVCAACCWLRLTFCNFSTIAIAVSEAALISLAAIYNPWWLQRSTEFAISAYMIIGFLFSLSLYAAYIKQKGNSSCPE